MEILFVCTGNICRSPMAEALFRERAARLGPDVDVSSAGLLFDDRAAEPRAVETMARLGYDIGGHRSRLLDADLMLRSDLVIGMEQRHVREAVTLSPEAFERTFTLPDLVERASAVGPRRSDESFEGWLEALGTDRTRSDVLRNRRMAEVADPIGRSKRAFRRCAAELTDLVDRLVDLAWPPTPRSDQHDVADPPTNRSL